MTCNLLTACWLLHLTVDITAILAFLHYPLGVFVFPLCHVQGVACSRSWAGCLSKAKTPCRLRPRVSTERLGSSVRARRQFVALMGGV